MELSGQLHAPVILPLGGGGTSGTHLDMRLDRPQS